MVAEKGKKASAKKITSTKVTDSAVKKLKEKNSLVIGIAAVVVIIATAGIANNQKTIVTEEKNTESISCNHVSEESDSIVKGETMVASECKNGEKTLTYKITRKGDEEISRELISEEVTIEPQDEITLIGTKEPVQEIEQPATRNTASPSSPTSSASSSDSGTKSTTGEYTGYCKDGTPATGNPHARGKANSCYGHGGWVGN